MSPLWIVLTLLPIFGGAERFNCRGRILGAYYADAKSGCKAFHVCVRVAGGGVRDFRFFCPPGTLFHQEAQTCTDWGDDDALACPADIYDGQFDLYKIGSGYDTKKLTQANREDEAEFGLQRAETGDRRLSQNNGGSNGVTSDLRAAHSSDFFSGQRDRGRDDSAPTPSQVQQPASPPASQSRQSFRRPTTARSTPPSTSYTTYNPPSSSPTPLYSKGNRYDHIPKRKVGRKRPIYTTTQTSPTLSSNTFAPQIYSEQPKVFSKRIPSQNAQITASAVIPPAYKDEYVEVSRVTPKNNKYFPNSPSSTPFSEPSTEQPKSNGNVNFNNYDVQSTSGFNGQNENRPFKLRNSFSVVSDDVKENDFLRSQTFNGNSERINPNKIDVSTTTRTYVTTTQSYKNANSLSFDQDKNNYNQFLSSKQNYYTNPTTTLLPVTTTYSTTVRYEPAQNLNTIAYNTNNAFNAQTSNFADSSEDDGQYRPPEGEDDGQYRPELYERELLSGAHSLNIAASGNRLFEDHKQQSKNYDKELSEKPVGKTSAPRPFRPAPTASAPTHSSHATEITYPTTTRPVSENSQRTFDFYQTYTTTSRPYDASGPVNNNGAFETISTRITSISPPRTYEPQRKQNRETVPPVVPSTAVPKPYHRPQHFSKNKNNKEDTSYDYAYYDSDPGFSEYEHIEEFGRTNIKA